MKEIDEEINEILDKFCQNKGELKVDGEFHKVYKQHKGAFNQMVNDYELITKNIQGKISLKPFGIEVCDAGGWIRWKEKEKLENNKNKKLNEEIRGLTKKNLKLQNRKLGRDITMWIIGVIMALIGSNLSLIGSKLSIILKFLKEAFH